jgi:putative transcriptional regulator
MEYKNGPIVFSRPTGGNMKTQFEQMMAGLDEVEAFLAGKQEGFKAHVPQEVDVKAIRNRLGMTQARFSDTFGFSLDAIKHWEGGRRTPEASARTLLTVIDKNPAAVLTALNPAAFAAAVGSSRPATVHVRVDRKPRASRGVTRRKTYSAGGKRITR